ncbi:MAG TPA: transporter [Pseudonocardia sp.]|nr:transporter [Pseudonocardia sp.]
MSALRGATAVVGIGQTPLYKRGTSPDPELKLCLRAIVAACEDAGIDPRDVDGFVSYGLDKNDPPKLAAGLGTRELRFSAMNWTHGGGIPGAVGLAAAGIVAGQADVVVVYRAIAESAGQRLRVAVAQDDTAAQYLVNGIDGPAQMCAMRTQRLLAEGVPRETLRAMAMASYQHAQNNPDAVAYGRPLDEAAYDSSRWISEPYHLFDCSRESDAAVAVVLVSAERARDLRQKPAYLLSSPTGATGAAAGLEENHTPYGSANFGSVARRLWSESGYGPSDVDVVQVYENMTGMGVAALIDHGFCTPETAGEVLTLKNLTAPDGGLPVNTSGGNLAEGFIHGMSLVAEAVRQIRGTSCNQVPGAGLSLMTGGPGDPLVSSALFASDSRL